VQRAIERFPKQGSKAPWRLYQNYALDIMTLRFGAIEDGSLEFSTSRSTTPAPEPVAA
jgi:monooxygenase